MSESRINSDGGPGYRDGYRPSPIAEPRRTFADGRWTVILTRELAHPVKRVWGALTEPGQLRRWAPFAPDRNLGNTGEVSMTMLDGAESDGAESDGAESDGAESDGAESDGAESGGAESGGAESGGAESGGAESGGAESGGAESGRAESSGDGSGGAESDSGDARGPDSTTAESDDSAVQPGYVLESDPPHLLVYRWGQDVLRWELTSTESGTTLVLRHTLHDEDFTSAVAAGWHLCLDAADALMKDVPFGPVVGSRAKEYGWDDLNLRYAELLGVKASFT